MTSDTDIDPRTVEMPDLPVDIALAALQMVSALGTDGENYFIRMSEKMRLMAIKAGSRGEGRLTLTWINGHPHKIEMTLTDNPYRGRC